MQIVIIVAIATLLVLSRTTISEAAKGPECLGHSLEYISSHRITTKACPLDDVVPVSRNSGLQVSAALRHLREGENSKAIALLSSIISAGNNIDIDIDIAYALRAQAHKNMRNNVKAAHDYTECIAINARRIECYINRGNIWMKNGFWDDAALDYTSALQIDSYNPIPLTYRGYARFMAKKGLGAADDLSKAIALDQSYAPAYFYRAAVMFRAYEREWASADLMRYLELKPTDMDAISLKKIIDDEIKIVRNRQASSLERQPHPHAAKPGRGRERQTKRHRRKE